MAEAPITVHPVKLTGMITRLEAATSRLEDMASAAMEVPKANGKLATAPGVVADGIPSPPSPKTVAEPLPALVADFDTFIANAVKNYVSLSAALGGQISGQVCNVLSSHLSELTGLIGFQSLSCLY
jgi:adenylyl cyclase-associated protein